MVLGYDVKEPPPYFPWGSAYHIFREKLQIHIDRFIIEGKDNAAILAFQPAMDAAIEYWKKHGKDQDKDSKFPHCNEGMLKLACNVAYSQVLQDIQSRRLTVIATEQAFTLKLPNSDYYVGGRVDEGIKKSGRILERDFKTTSGKTIEWYARGVEPNAQFSTYTWAFQEMSKQKTEGVLVEVLNVDKKKGPEIYEILTERTPTQITVFLDELVYWLDQMKLSREKDIYPMNENSCWNCEFHSVCKRATESGQLTQLRSNYRFRPWNFYEIRD